MNLDPHKQETKQIAERLMKAWLKGRIASNDHEAIKRKAREFREVAEILQGTK